MTKQKRNKSQIIVFGSFLLAFSLIIGYNSYRSHDEKQNEKLVIEYINNTSIAEVKLSEDLVAEDKNVTKEEKKELDYYAVLEIPVISLKKGLVNPKSNLNTVNKNIEIIMPSDMPDTQNSNLILAGHSGNGIRAYFKDLNKLNGNSDIYLYYNGVRYNYKLVDVYEADKDGYLPIYRNKSATTLTLITCSQTDKTKQIIYIAELLDKQYY